MKIILTHDNADFDAIASLLGMYKVDPTAYPILPQRINRNVSQFLLLYAGALPATQREDLPNNPSIELAYVVDTQSYNMVRGMKKDTPIHYIDHHPLDKTLPPHHKFEGEQLGANTTLLIEQLMERDVPVTSLEATLLLLGIYEDTGSLTYRNTSARDLRAAAWLLERQGDLDVVRRFLSYPLNDDQKAAFDVLKDSTMILQIQSYHVAVASTVLPGQVDELSTLAHRLRDFFECDALIMAIQIEKHVQLIARSITDNIDVGAVIRSFGGGGHERAAATLIRDQALESVLEELITVLHKTVRPAVLVADMMSWGVQSILAEATVGEAHNAMLETGHEGYPVLQEGKLAGLLTRRAVDRAMRHNMQHTPVKEVMEAGKHSVKPSDSIETLKDQILESGWGQMPVVDEEQHVVGIVTRTDLINRWGQAPTGKQRQQEMITRLRSGLPSTLWKLLEKISETAISQGYGLFLVGGIVRDLLLNRPNIDIDLVVEGDGINLGRLLRAKYGGTLHQHEQFGTATWKLDAQVAIALGAPGAEKILPATVDFATSRAEFYEAPTALPTVRKSSIKLDLHRRDFTINTLAIRLAPLPIGDLLDFYKGEQDLRNGVIRVLHSLSFVDDPTRILRAVRFEKRFGFHIEARTMQRLKAALPLIERVSGDRLRHEMNLLLKESHPFPVLMQLENLGILKAIHPALKVYENAQLDFSRLEQVRRMPPWTLPADYDDWRILTFSLITNHMSEDEIREVGKRLMTSRRTVEQLLSIQRSYNLQKTLVNASTAEIVDALEPLGQSAWLSLWITGDDRTREIVENYVTRWQHIRATLDGHDLAKMGLKPGKALGQILKALRTAWLNGDVKNADEELIYAQHLIQKHTANP